MSDQSTPPVPEEIPEHLRTEISNLDAATLSKLQDWICTSPPSQQESPIEDEIVDFSEKTASGAQILATLTVDEKQEIDVSELLGTFTWQLVQCSKEQCQCTSGQAADLHGPYLQRLYIDDSGHYASEYISPDDVRQTLVQRTIPKPSV